MENKTPISLESLKPDYMKNILILISVFLFSFSLNVQKSKKVEGRTFNDITVELYKGTESAEYFVKLTFPAEYGKESININKKSTLYTLMDLIASADTRKGFHDFIRFRETINGQRHDEYSIMVRHAKKSDYIGIGKTYNFKYGRYGVLRENAGAIYNYLEKLRRLL
jgi:hypothetical protein